MAMETATSPPPPQPPMETFNAPSNPNNDFPIAPQKLTEILKVFIPFLAFYVYLIVYHCEIETGLRRSILIDHAIGVVGLWVTLFLIPVASTYLLKANLFGSDINTTGTPQGSIKVPESLGIVVEFWLMNVIGQILWCSF